MQPTYADAKNVVIAILDEVTNEDLAHDYGLPGRFNTKSRLFLDLGIPPERMAVMAPRINRALKDTFPEPSRVTSSGLLQTKSIGDVISLFCKAAKLKVPQGEPT